jgi:hypothetical protein
VVRAPHPARLAQVGTVDSDSRFSEHRPGHAVVAGTTCRPQVEKPGFIPAARFVWPSWGSLFSQVQPVATTQAPVVRSSSESPAPMFESPQAGPGSLKVASLLAQPFAERSDYAPLIHSVLGRDRWDGWARTQGAVRTHPGSDLYFECIAGGGRRSRRRVRTQGPPDRQPTRRPPSDPI